MFLSLSGSDGSAADLPLAASPAAFEPSSIDTFTIMLPHLGKLHAAALHLGPEGARPGWHLAWLHVAAEEPHGADAHGAAANPEEYRFVYKCALPRGSPAHWYRVHDGVLSPRPEAGRAAETLLLHPLCRCAGEFVLRSLRACTDARTRVAPHVHVRTGTPACTCLRVCCTTC